jgi:[protein-PII] uridylyltransferase
VAAVAALRARRAEVLADWTQRGAGLRSALVDAVDTCLDAVVGDLLADSAWAGSGLAVLVVGAYGRREPAAGSDLDLVLVHDGRADVAPFVDRLLYPLWDTGFPVDHSTRTIDEALAVAAQDLRAALGLLDARHVAGDPQLAADLVERTRGQWRSGIRRRLPDLVRGARERWQAHGELPFLLEPDLKLARGGLRDVQLLRALALGWLTDPPEARVEAAYTGLLDVRGELHRRPGRPSDRLLLQEQDAIAVPVGYGDADALMRDVYAAARTIAFAADQTLRRVQRDVAPRRRLFGRSPSTDRIPLASDVVAQDGEVVLAVGADPARDPGLVLRVAAAAAEQGLPIAPHALARLAGSAALPEPWPAPARDDLVTLLGAGYDAVAVVETLDQAGLLQPLLPEWEQVRCKPQRNAYHRFTVDRHLVECAAEAAALTRRVARPDLLLLGALLHDIGKGLPGDHTDNGVALVARIGPRLGLAPDDTATLVAMVRHHLLLPDTATRRDLEDPVTVQRVADAVGDRDTLDLLHALAEADGRATGPAAWSEWKAGLVDELVSRTRAVLAGAPAPAAAALSARQLALADRRETALDVDGDTLTVVTPDRPGVLWRWAGVLALHRLDVRGAIATSTGAMAVTVFDAVPRFGSPPDWEIVRTDLRRAEADTAWLADRLAARERDYRRDPHHPSAASPPRVLFDDAASASATVVEVRAHDRLGLLYRLAHALADHGLDVRSARVSTLGAEAVDAFYVVDEFGGPLPSGVRRAAVEAALLAALAD